ncbi:DUF1877 family protein [Prescottella agglutinans]|uniref:DUF1877 family protein n=1 Tax=Prescottella agglutinans TaxID=1644129 RepID=UPI003D977E7A
MELGVHFALSARVAAELLDARGDDGKLGAVVDDIEETGRSEFSCDTDKAWDPILCSLSSAGYQRAPENWPAYGVILGDEDLNTDTDDQLITYLAPDRVTEVAAYLAGITESEFGAGYDAMPLDDRNPEYGADERAYAWDWLQEVMDFFERAARDDRHVVFTVRF